jgi:tetratricopeptide (TPR) repeat protein
MPRFLQILIPILIAAVCAVGPVRGADTESKPEANLGNADFAVGKKAIEAKDWNAAAAAFEKVVKRDPKNADAYNLLGYSDRWLGKMDESFAAYGRALAIEPNHRGAHEYIGVAYLKVKQPAKAEEHLARLEKICGKNCEEYKDLAKAVAEYKP